MSATPVLDRLTQDTLALGPDAPPEKETANWRLTRADGVAWLMLDCRDAPVNVVSQPVLEELAEILDRLEESPPEGLVLRSAKAGGFAAGADVGMLRKPGTAEEVEAWLRRAHAAVDRLEALQCPTVAVIHGHCLGAGLEIALACRTRIARSDAELGFPEVMLGLHPGLGGTARASELVDPTEAMKLMLRGKPAPAKKAESIGLVDALVEERHVPAAVRAVVAGELHGSRRGLRASAMATEPARRLAARKMRAKTAERASKAHYPAPYALIDLWESHGGDAEAMKEAEIASFARLVTGETAQNLIRVFFLRERLQKIGKAQAEIGHVHVLGAGEMGGDIAGWCAQKGLRVTVTDLDREALAVAIGRASSMFGEGLPDEGARRAARDRLIPDFAGDGARHADLVIEAIAEKAEAKRKLYAALEPDLKPHAVIATNTSSVPLADLREGLERPERVVGLHFFNPVAKMQVIEVVFDDVAAADAVGAAKAFCGRVDKLPAPVRSAPGFLVNRILVPYVAEALALVDEGAAPETVDRAAEHFGMAMGPIAVADQVGLDIALDVAEKLRAAIGPTFPEPPAWAREKVDEGKLGKKSGEGHYRWSGGEPDKRSSASEPEEGMIDRLILPMVNTSAACVREGVVEDPDMLDAAMIFAAGFAPFRGGPANYVRHRGVDDVRGALERLRATHGDRFTPDTGLDALARGTG